MRKHPVVVVSDPVGCVGSCRGLFVFIPNIFGLHVAVFGVSSYYMKKFKPGGGWCSVFVEKTETCKFFMKKC